MTRTTDGGLLYTSRNAFVFSKFSKFIVFGKLFEKRNVIWKNTKVKNGVGVISSSQVIIDPAIHEFFVERATEMHNNFQKTVSKKQKIKIMNFAFDNIEKFSNSELYKALDADYSSKLSDKAFSKRKYGRNDLCPCGSGKKFKTCHGK